LSLSRVVLGAVVLAELSVSASSYLVLPAVLAAAAADWLDGRLARSLGAASAAGRVLDNLCDGAFLAMCFGGFAMQQVWSDPLVGSATRYWEHANWLPLVAFAAAFGLYLLRWALCTLTGAPMMPSLRGHSAGVFNYALTILGGVAVLPDIDVTRWILEPAFVTVALLNATAVSENLLLLLRVRSS
jgi:phosphatidylglycerophosphate synthase